jgi:hypothetical protein
MIARLLTYLFPPTLPSSPVRDWGERAEEAPNEQGSIGPVKSPPYRNGIERYFAENPLAAKKS